MTCAVTTLLTRGLGCHYLSSLTLFNAIAKTSGLKQYQKQREKAIWAICQRTFKAVEDLDKRKK